MTQQTGSNLMKIITENFFKENPKIVTLLLKVIPALKFITDWSIFRPDTINLWTDLNVKRLMGCLGTNPYKSSTSPEYGVVDEQYVLPTRLSMMVFKYLSELIQQDVVNIYISFDIGHLRHIVIHLTMSLKATETGLLTLVSSEVTSKPVADIINPILSEYINDNGIDIFGAIKNVGDYITTIEPDLDTFILFYSNTFQIIKDIQEKCYEYTQFISPTSRRQNINMFIIQIKLEQTLSLITVLDYFQKYELSYGALINFLHCSNPVSVPLSL